MDEIINPDRLVSVPFNKTRCGVDFYINTAINKDIGLVLTENKRLRQTSSASTFSVRQTDICY